MGAIRRRYSAPCNFFADDGGGTNRIHWYTLPDDAPLYPDPHVFFPRIDDIQNPSRGHYYEKTGPARNIRRYVSLPDFLYRAGDHFHGDASDYQGDSLKAKYRDGAGHINPPCVAIIRLNVFGLLLGGVVEPRALESTLGLALGALGETVYEIRPAGLLLGGGANRFGDDYFALDLVKIQTAGIAFGGNIVDFELITFGLAIGGNVIASGELAALLDAGVMLGGVTVPASEFFPALSAGVMIGGVSIPRAAFTGDDELAACLAGVMLGGVSSHPGFDVPEIAGVAVCGLTIGDVSFVAAIDAGLMLGATVEDVEVLDPTAPGESCATAGVWELGYSFTGDAPVTGHEHWWKIEDLPAGNYDFHRLAPSNPLRPICVLYVGTDCGSLTSIATLQDDLDQTETVTIGSTTDAWIRTLAVGPPTNEYTVNFGLAAPTCDDAVLVDLGTPETITLDEDWPAWRKVVMLPGATYDFYWTLSSGAISVEYKIGTTCAGAGSPVSLPASTHVPLTTGSNTYVFIKVLGGVGGGEAELTVTGTVTPVKMFITSGTTFTAPSLWPGVADAVECIGGGGGGKTSTLFAVGVGGGGGAYSKATTVSAVNGCTIQVGQGGAANASGTDTWFNGANLAASSCGAKAGAVGAGTAQGLGGASSSGIGSLKYSGGDGGTRGGNGLAGGGGGGAAGPNGVGKSGGNGGNVWGAGGGGAGGGSSTAGANSTSVTPAGPGGLAQDGTAGGVGLAGAHGTSGSHGSGGGGGPGGGSFHAGGQGGDGIEWDSTHGAGGGGGGGGNSNGAGTQGGLYGGGGGGGAPNTGVGGAGRNGIIVLTYTPALDLDVTTI